MGLVYLRRPEFKSFGPDGKSCKADTHGLLKLYSIKAWGHLIGKEMERGSGQAEDISSLMPSLVHYQGRDQPGPAEPRSHCHSCEVGIRHG